MALLVVKMSEKVQQTELDLNADRLLYLLDLYKMSREDLVTVISGKRKKFSVKDLDAILTNKKIKLPLLQKIDKLFEKGVAWYISDRNLPEKKISSIFFRKDQFNSDLNFEAKKLTSKFEEKKFQVQALCNYINFDLKRTLKNFSIEDDPRIAARNLGSEFNEIEKKLLSKNAIKEPKKDFDYLKNYIQLLSAKNIFVFEFIENWNKKEIANFNGFFMSPNIIVLKRQNYRREIFTLFHELAHYLLNSEEIDELKENELDQPKQSKTEKWCNDFAYYLLAGDYHQTIEQLEKGTKENSYHEETVNSIYSQTRLSKLAVYTRLRIENKLSVADYRRIYSEIIDSINRDEHEKKLKKQDERQLKKELGIKQTGFAQKPILSNLFKDIVKINYFEGNIDELGLCNYLNIPPAKIEKEIY